MVQSPHTAGSERPEPLEAAVAFLDLESLALEDALKYADKVASSLAPERIEAAALAFRQNLARVEPSGCPHRSLRRLMERGVCGAVRTAVAESIGTASHEVKLMLDCAELRVRVELLAAAENDAGGRTVALLLAALPHLKAACGAAGGGGGEAAAGGRLGRRAPQRQESREEAKAAYAAVRCVAAWGLLREARNAATAKATASPAAAAAEHDGTPTAGFEASLRAQVEDRRQRLLGLQRVVAAELAARRAERA